MCTVTYYKLGGSWFLDLPEYFESSGALEEDLERIGSFHEALEKICEGRETVQFKMKAEAFDGCDVLTLTGTSGENTGGYYFLEELNGRKIETELWFNKVIYHYFNTLPEKIYIQLIK